MPAAASAASRRDAALRRLRALAVRHEEVLGRVAGDPELAARVRALETYQARRLARTYSDLRQTSRYRAAVDFFLGELYGPQDLTERDAQMLQALDRLGRYLPRVALEALTQALELHVLTLELDAVTAAGLADRAVPGDDGYARAYRRAGRRPDRERQIALIGSVGRLLDAVAHRPDVGLLVRVARGPAHAAGYGRLQDFLERGYAAFRAMHGAGEFLEAVEARERALLQHWFR